MADKILNNLFVWGQSLDNSTDLASITFSGSTPVKGFEGGKLIYNDILNSAIRNSSLMGRTIIDSLKLGPNTTYNTNSTANVGTWDNNWAEGQFNFNYAINNNDVSGLATDLKTIFDQYIRYSQCAIALTANAWTNSRKFKIQDWDGTNSGLEENVNGTTNVTLSLPQNMKGSIENVSDSINGKSISNIFEINGTRVKSATYATKIGSSSSSHPAIGSDVFPVNVASTGSIVECYYGSIGIAKYINAKKVYWCETNHENDTPIQTLTYTLNNNLQISSYSLFGNIKNSTASGDYGAGTLTFNITSSAIGRISQPSSVSFKITLSDIIGTDFLPSGVVIDFLSTGQAQLIYTTTKKGWYDNYNYPKHPWVEAFSDEIYITIDNNFNEVLSIMVTVPVILRKSS